MSLLYYCVVAFAIRFFAEVSHNVSFFFTQFFLMQEESVTILASADTSLASSARWLMGDIVHKRH